MSLVVKAAAMENLVFMNERNSWCLGVQQKDPHELIEWVFKAQDDRERHRNNRNTGLRA